MIDADGTLHALGTLFPSSMLPDRAPPGKSLVTAICRGLAGSPERVLSDLKATFGVQGEPEYVRVVRHPEGIPQYTVGHRARVQAARALLPAGLQLAGATYDGVGVPDVAQSGAAAAERLIRSE
jgi:oxygen-dependent protoporphyrinogen oxidase